MKKGDIIILGFIIIVFSASLFSLNCAGEYDNLKCIIKVDGKIYKEIKLSPDYNNYVEINSSFGYNKISIEGNTVKIIKSDCEDKLCLSEGVISKPFQSIICLPARLIVYIEGNSELDYVSY